MSRAIDESIARRLRWAEMVRKREQAEFACTVFRACLVGVFLIVMGFLVWRIVTSEARERAAYLEGLSEEVPA